MLFSIKGWEVGIFWSGGKVLVIHFRKYMTSYGLRTLCNDPETLTKWKVSVTKSFSHISLIFLEYNELYLSKYLSSRAAAAR